MSSMLSSRSQKMSRLALSRLTSLSYVKRWKRSASSRCWWFSGLKQATKSSRSARVSGLFFSVKRRLLRSTRNSTRRGPACRMSRYTWSQAMNVLPLPVAICTRARGDLG